MSLGSPRGVGGGSPRPFQLRLFHSPSQGRRDFRDEDTAILGHRGRIGSLGRRSEAHGRTAARPLAWWRECAHTSVRARECAHKCAWRSPRLVGGARHREPIFPFADHPRESLDFAGGTEEKWISQVNEPVLKTF